MQQADAAIAAEQPQAAIAPLLAAVRAAPENVELRLRLAEILYTAGHPSQAGGLYRTALAQEPGDPRAASGLALVLERTGGLEQAEALLVPFLRQAGPCHTNVVTPCATRR